MTDYPAKAKDRAQSLIEGLQELHQRDPDQDVREFALPVFDAVVETIKDDIGRDNPVVAAVQGVLSSERIATGDPILVSDALLVAKMLDAEIGPRPRAMPRGSVIASPDVPRRRPSA